jgi:hypothetical protein
MSSIRKQVTAALDAADAAYRTLASLPLEALSRADKHALLGQLQQFDTTLKALDRRLIGRLVTEADPAQFGAASWADLLSRRLRISPGEAQRRIDEATAAVPIRSSA